MGSASVSDMERHADGDGPDAAAFELLALVEALRGVEELLTHPSTTSATAREELCAASEIVGWVLELLPSAADLRELQEALLRGQTALAAAAERPEARLPWDDVRTCLTTTRRLLTVTAASLMP
jgi:hypothetical protein